jgi:hypothetical protein
MMREKRRYDTDGIGHIHAMTLFSHFVVEKRDKYNNEEIFFRHTNWSCFYSNEMSLDHYELDIT